MSVGTCWLNKQQLSPNLFSFHETINVIEHAWKAKSCKTVQWALKMFNEPYQLLGYWAVISLPQINDKNFYVTKGKSKFSEELNSYHWTTPGLHRSCHKENKPLIISLSSLNNLSILCVGAQFFLHHPFIAQFLNLSRFQIRSAPNTCP